MFASWVDADPRFERLAPVPFSTICLRLAPPALNGETPGDHEARLDALNLALIDAVNRTGEVFLSHTRLRGRFAIRVALGQIRTEDRHVARAWALLQREAEALG